MNNNYISLIALIVAVFFSGVYLRGESARKQDIKRELDAIRARQAEIIATVDAINQQTEERDQLLLSRIDSARTYVDLLSIEEDMTSQKVAMYGENIKRLQLGIDSSLTQINASRGFVVAAPAPEVVESSQ